MKNQSYIWLAISTVFLIAVAVTAHYQMNFPFVYSLVIIGQLVLIFTVYKVLTDKYSTDKTFNDWYEDKPQKDKTYSS